jgi:hypothetical protein
MVHLICKNQIMIFFLLEETESDTAIYSKTLHNILIDCCFLNIQRQIFRNSIYMY